MIRTSDYSNDIVGNCMICDFYHTRNTNAMIEISSNNNWQNIVVVYDECDMGGYKSTLQRLKLIETINAECRCKLHVMFVTATCANFSKSIFKIYNNNSELFLPNTIVDNLLTKKITTHYHALASDSYIGPSWFQKTPGVHGKPAVIIFGLKCFISSPFNFVTSSNILTDG